MGCGHLVACIEKSLAKLDRDLGRWQVDDVVGSEAFEARHSIRDVLLHHGLVDACDQRRGDAPLEGPSKHLFPPALRREQHGRRRAETAEVGGGHTPPIQLVQVLSGAGDVLRALARMREGYGRPEIGEEEQRYCERCEAQQPAPARAAH